ncbi:hypothetical protein A2Z67_06010 [Candidatus Woesebacteria bacterium RBG_13_36_22]|uniref:Class I SAM-dependent methyltransferase n=1 Tax=Candidatus Woesebacteria bacterium RBG_13_36_22 TaxID=1802478 RepID=A0A1F7X065_9BACT|nr:MAG: hypothetical protein A2Z67_06010 [Candidatus Woesebacteria bacterium RBG_13_36_22]
MGYDFNKWRENYDRFSYKEQQSEYNIIYEAGPVQRSFHLPSVKEFLLQCKPSVVLEIGGWDGGLASEILFDNSFDFIHCWYNFEICEEAVKRGLKNIRYFPLIPETWVWEIELPNADVLIASHFIEHIKVKQLKQVISKLPESIQFVFLQAPLEENGDDISWQNYYGSHILEVGWKQVELIMENKGFKGSLINSEVRVFSKKSKA